jgi:uncharacterized protein YcbK (DUF882 family)
MSRINARIRAAIQRRAKWRRVLERRDTREVEIAGAVKDVNDRIRRKQTWRKRLLDPKYRPWLSEEQRDEKRETHADELEELRAAREVLLDQLARTKRVTQRARDQLVIHRKEVERLQRRREQIAKDSEGQLTRDFHVREFDCRDGTRVPEAAVPALRELCQRHLQPLRDSGGVVSINSGYRTASYNAAIGGATASYHIYDQRPHAPAADHIQSDRSASEVQAWHDSHNSPDGMGYYAGFTHIDDRGYASRWWGAG